MAISKLILNGETQMDVTSNTNTAANMLSGVVGTKNDGTSVTGNIATKTSSDLTASGATVTAPAGYYANAASKAVSTTTHPNPTAAITSSTGVVTASHTQGTGYVTGGTTTGTLNLTTQGATTYNTSTADQTIASNRWLTGAQTIKGVITSNLTAENIAEGVIVKVGDANNASRITQITGTHSGASSYTATISGSGNSSYCYVTYNGTKYYTDGNTFTFKASDTLTIYCRGNRVSFYTTSVTLSNYTYTYTLPTGDIDIYLTYDSSTSNSVQINYPIIPSGDYYVGNSGWFPIPEYDMLSVPAGSVFPPAVTITKAPTIGVNTSGVVTASYNGSSSITPTVTSGYISQGTAGTISTTGTSTYQLTSKAAATYYPSTADQTIASQRWLVGNQTIKSVTTSNLTAENIAEGVVVKVGDSSNASRITQITGTHKGSIGPTYTATIVSSGEYDTMGMLYNYVVYDNVLYFTEGQTFEFSAGDSLHCRLNAWDSTYTTSIYIDGELVKQAAHGTNYDYILPASDIEIKLNTACTLMYIDRVSLSITENGKYEVGGYGYANVDVTSPYYSTYQKIAQNLSTIDNTDSDYLSFIGVIHSNAFQGRQFAAGVHNFTNVSIIHPYGMAGPRQFWEVPDSSIIFSFPKVTTISSYAFQERKIFNEIYCEKCTTIGSTAFMSCYSLKTISFPSCTFIGMNAFRDCYSLVSAIFPQCTQISQYAFSNCSALTTASFAKCTNMGPYTFCDCSNLINISFPSCQQISLYAFGYCSSLASAIFPLCESIYTSAFLGCRNLSIASFSVCTSIGASAFLNCTGLQTISFPECNTIGYSAFYNCSALTSVFLPKCYSIGQYAFALCSALSLVTISATTNPLSIGTYAFVSCYSLKEVHLSNCSLIGFSAFSRCYNLISLYLTSISSVPTLSYGVFYSSPIGGYSTSAGRYGSVFVPASLYNSFLTAVYWSAISSRIVSV